jgi:hypothetical protein
MMEGLSADGDRHLQQMAARIEQRLFRSRVRQADRLLATFRSALRREGLIRVRAKWSGADLVFRAELGSKLKGRLLNMKLLSSQDLVNGCTVRAARRCELDPGIEDFAAWRHVNRLEGLVRSVPFRVVTRALDKMLNKWVAERQPQASH